GLARKSKILRVEWPGVKSAGLPVKQMSLGSAGRDGRVGDVRSGMEEKPSLVRIERPQKDAGGVLGPGGPRGIAHVKKVAPVRQKERPSMTELTRAHIDLSHR